MAGSRRQYSGSKPFALEILLVKKINCNLSKIQLQLFTASAFQPQMFEAQGRLLPYSLLGLLLEKRGVWNTGVPGAADSYGQLKAAFGQSKQWRKASAEGEEAISRKSRL